MEIGSMGDNPEPCRASQLIEHLVRMIAEFGDVPILARDPDTGWVLTIGLVYCKEPDDDWPSRRIEIRSSYHGMPTGYIAPRWT